MKIGAEPKKIAILVGLLAVAVYQFSSWDTGGGAPAPSPRPPAATSAPAPAGAQSQSGAATQADLSRGRAAQRRAERGSTRRSSSNRTLREFRPVLDTTTVGDPMQVDPSLRLDLLEKVRSVSIRGGSRNLFQFGTRPVEPVAAKPKLPDVAKILPGAGPSGELEPAAQPKPLEPAAPPIPFQYYGFSQKVPQGKKRAFFLEGEEIHVASEGEMIKRRYKVVRIGVNSVVVEDTNSNKEQTLRMVEQIG